MKKLNEKSMEQTQGGSVETAIIGGIACTLTAGSWLIPGGGLVGTAIFGPTCAGMVIGTIAD